MHNKAVREMGLLSGDTKGVQNIFPLIEEYCSTMSGS